MMYIRRRPHTYEVKEPKPMAYTGYWNLMSNRHGSFTNSSEPYYSQVQLKHLLEAPSPLIYAAEFKQTEQKTLTP